MAELTTQQMIDTIRKGARNDGRRACARGGMGARPVAADRQWRKNYIGAPTFTPAPSFLKMGSTVGFWRPSIRFSASDRSRSRSILALYSRFAFSCSARSKACSLSVTPRSFSSVARQGETQVMEKMTKRHNTSLDKMVDEVMEPPVMVKCVMAQIQNRLKGKQTIHNMLSASIINCCLMVRSPRPKGTEPIMNKTITELDEVAEYLGDLFNYIRKGWELMETAKREQADAR